jgi:DNA-binding NarL/FixJ family response regulator
MTSIRVIVADDEALVRAGFQAILESAGGIEVVGEASDGQAAVDLARALAPDVVLMDIRMGGVDGLEAARRLLGDPRPPRIVMLTTFGLDEYVYAAMKQGAAGFLLKDVPREQLVTAVRAVAAGETLVAPTIVRRLVEDFVRRPPPGSRRPPALAALSQRELDVLKLLAEGLSNAEIADRLFLSEATVKTHVARTLGKLGLRDRVQAVVLAYESGLIEARGGKQESGQE